LVWDRRFESTACSSSEHVLFAHVCCWQCLVGGKDGESSPDSRKHICSSCRALPRRPGLADLDLCAYPTPISNHLRASRSHPRLPPNSSPPPSDLDPVYPATHSLLGPPRRLASLLIEHPSHRKGYLTPATGHSHGLPCRPVLQDICILQGPV